MSGDSGLVDTSRAMHERTDRSRRGVRRGDRDRLRGCRGPTADRRRAGREGRSPRSRAGDGVQLVADVDPDRAPGDAAPAADAAGAAELVPPGGELVGQPLTVAVLDAGPEVAAGDGAKPDVKQLSQDRSATDSWPSRSDRWLTLVQKQVGQTRVQFVQARQRSATSAQCGLSRLASRRAGSPSVSTGSPIARTWPRLRRSRRRAARRRRAHRQPSRERGPGRRPDPHDEAVVQLGQGEVEPVPDLGPGAASRCRSRCCRGHALDRDDEHARRVARCSPRRRPARPSGSGPGSRAPPARRRARRGRRRVRSPAPRR